MPEPMDDEERWQRDMERKAAQDAAWIGHEMRNAGLEAVHQAALVREFTLYFEELEAIRAKYTPE